MAKVTVLTNNGEGWCAGRLVGTESTEGKFIGWGIGGGTAIKASATLINESAEARGVGVVSVEGSGSSAKWQCEGTLVSESDQTIAEAGAFSADAAGILIIHTTFDGLALNVDDQITFTFTIDPS